jgi:outer membrane murein-binding lipoprotein Lpp
MTPRRIALYGVLGVLLLALAFLSGRRSVHAVTVTQKVQDDTKVRELTAQIEQLKRDTHSVTTTVRKPDGTVKRRKVTDTHVAESTQTETATKTEQHTETVATVVQHSDAPFRRLGPLVAIDLTSGSISYGAMFQTRVLGPLDGSVFVLAGGKTGIVLGLGLSIEF